MTDRRSIVVDNSTLTVRRWSACARRLVLSVTIIDIIEIVAVAIFLLADWTT